MTLGAARWLLVVLAVVAFAVGVDNMSRPLANPDEGRYSEISREMSLSGDWVVQKRYSGIRPVEPRVGTQRLRSR